MKSFKPDVSSVSTSPEELLVVCGFICRKWSHVLHINRHTGEIIICYVEALMSPVTKGQIFPVLEILIFFFPIDNFKPPKRDLDKPFRFCVSDIYKGKFYFVWIWSKLDI